MMQHLSNSTIGPALAAPKSLVADNELSLVIFIIAMFSISGSGFVILSYIFLKELRSFRHLLILGLSISDFLMAVNFAASTGMNLSGRHIWMQEQKTFCSVNGFITQLFVISTDYWVLVVAIATYIILGNLRRSSEWIQVHKWILWTLPWAIASIWATIGLLTAGYGNIGAWCWFTSDFVRIVVNFIPRWLIIIIIAVLYSRLYFIIIKAHRWNIESMNPNAEEEDTSSMMMMHMNAMVLPDTPKAVYSPSSTNISRGSVRHIQVVETTPVTTIHHPSIGLSHQSHKSTRSHGQTAPMNAQLLKRVAMKMALYPLMYCIIWAIPTAIRIYQAASGKPAPLPITIVDKSCIVCQGFVDAFVYGLNERAWQSWRDLICKNVFTTIPENAGQNWQAESFQNNQRLTGPIIKPNSSVSQS